MSKDICRPKRRVLIIISLTRNFVLIIVPIQNIKIGCIIIVFIQWTLGVLNEQNN